MNYKAYMIEYIKKEKLRDPGICILTYPYSFIWESCDTKYVNNLWRGRVNNQKIAVYIHIPFCYKKCNFCGFHSFPGIGYSKIKEYLLDLQIELSLVSNIVDKRNIDAICIGGGTPNILRTEEISSLLQYLKKNLKPGMECEISLEIFPDASATPEKLAVMRRNGVNRLSFGVQSFNQLMKINCNRHDTVKQNYTVLQAARDAGFDNINIDLLCGLPNQSMDIWVDSVQRLLELKPEHACIFPFSIRHPGIPFYEKIKSTLPPLEEVKEMYFLAREALMTAGYIQTTRHNFEKPGKRYKYERHQSLCSPLLGLGANSISYVPGLNYKNVPDLDAYANAVRNGTLPVQTGFDLIKNEEEVNNFMVRRLTYLTIDKSEFRQLFGKEIEDHYPIQIEALIKTGLIEIDGDKLRLTEEGTYYTALVKRCFFSPYVNRLKQERYGRVIPPEREQQSGKQCHTLMAQQ